MNSRIKWATGVATTTIAATALVVAAFAGAGSSARDANPVRDLPEIRGEEIAVVTTAPAVPPAITRNHATKVVVNLDVEPQRRSDRRRRLLRAAQRARPETVDAEVAEVLGR